MKMQVDVLKLLRSQHLEDTLTHVRMFGARLESVSDVKKKSKRDDDRAAVCLT